MARRSLWLVVHKDLQKSPRVRAASDWLAELCRRERAGLMGARAAEA
jgi:hypothetical protein